MTKEKMKKIILQKEYTIYEQKEHIKCLELMITKFKKHIIICDNCHRGIMDVSKAMVKPDDFTNKNIYFCIDCVLKDAKKYLMNIKMDDYIECMADRDCKNHTNMNITKDNMSICNNHILNWIGWEPVKEIWALN